MTDYSSGHTHRRLRSVPLTALAIGAICVGVFSALGATTAQADDTTTPSVTAFYADECAGSAADDPTVADGAVANLTYVFGERLTQYQAGNAVALYDSFGTNNNDAYPPVCGVRFVDGVGAVSEWMFCTDISSHTCAGTDAAGNLLGIDGQIIAPMDGVEGNTKLDADQEKLIAWLIQNGHSYSGTGYYNWNGVTEGLSGVGSTSDSRIALQTLIWCISDAPDPSTPINAPSFTHDRLVTCDDNMDATEQAGCWR